jgi:hypothetical protein
MPRIFLRGTTGCGTITRQLTALYYCITVDTSTSEYTRARNLLPLRLYRLLNNLAVEHDLYQESHAMLSHNHLLLQGFNQAPDP